MEMFPKQITSLINLAERFVQAIEEIAANGIAVHVEVREPIPVRAHVTQQRPLLR